MIWNTLYAKPKNWLCGLQTDMDGDRRARGGIKKNRECSRIPYFVILTILKPINQKPMKKTNVLLMNYILSFLFRHLSQLLGEGIVNLTFIVKSDGL